MKRGKYICKELKAIRKEIAKENGIAYEPTECHYEGPCRGTCPKCESEVRMLERELKRRISLGKAVTIAGVSMSMAAFGTACNNEGKSDQLQGEPNIEDSAMASENECPEDSILVTGGVEDEDGAVIWDMPVPGGIEIIDTVSTTNDDGYIEGEVDEGDEHPYFPKEAEFPGGAEAMYKFLEDNLQYPDTNVTGKVFVRFWIESDGSITNIRIMKDIGGGCGEEVVRVIKMMPKWNPAKNREGAVRSEYSLPVMFGPR